MLATWELVESFATFIIYNLHGYLLHGSCLVYLFPQTRLLTSEAESAKAESSKAESAKAEIIVPYCNCKYKIELWYCYPSCPPLEACLFCWTIITLPYGMSYRHYSTQIQKLNNDGTSTSRWKFLKIIKMNAVVNIDVFIIIVLQFIFRISVHHMILNMCAH